jgi:hypothetical protein
VISFTAFVGIFIVLLGLGSLAIEVTHWFTENPADAPRENGQPLRGWPPEQASRTTVPPTEQPPAAEADEKALAPLSDRPGLLLPRTDSSESSFLTLGSSQSDVLRVQGTPSRVQGQTWIYGLSDIQFKEGRLARYNNFDGSLKIRLQPRTDGDKPETGYFTLGSTENDVLLAQGTPTRIETTRWHYGFSEIQFKNGRVDGFKNYYGNLRILILPATPSPPAAGKGFFTVGATPDEVLALQGTPTSVQGNLWRYELSSILFREGKVQNVINSDGNLRFLPPEEAAEREKHSG